jgi:hypothetical protein
MLGTPQFPPILGGWQWANNALYIREYVDVKDTTKFPSKETAELDRIARAYFRIFPRDQRELSSYVANFFIREPYAPLKEYMMRHYTISSDSSEVMAWGKVAPIFDQYGKYIIRHNPLAFCKYYLLLNTKNYFLPPLEKLEIYNLGSDKMWPIAGYWFDMPDLTVKVVSKSFQGYLLILYPGFYMALNLYFLWWLISFIRKGGLRHADSYFLGTLAIITLFLALNFAFSVFANIIVIRYQVFPMIIFLTFSQLLVDNYDLITMSTKQPDVEQPKNSLIPTM